MEYFLVVHTVQSYPPRPAFRQQHWLKIVTPPQSRQSRQRRKSCSYGFAAAGAGRSRSHRYGGCCSVRRPFGVSRRPADVSDSPDHLFDPRETCGSGFLSSCWSLSFPLVRCRCYRGVMSLTAAPAPRLVSVSRTTTTTPSC